MPDCFQPNSSIYCTSLDLCFENYAVPLACCQHVSKKKQKHTNNQPINQPTNQPTNQPNKPTINQPTNPPTHQPPTNKQTHLAKWMGPKIHQAPIAKYLLPTVYFTQRGKLPNGNTLGIHATLRRLMSIKMIENDFRWSGTLPYFYCTRVVPFRLARVLHWQPLQSNVLPSQASSSKISCGKRLQINVVKGFSRENVEWISWYHEYELNFQ